ncbi:unannotated protein [freshwater metagenome]|uniref:Unannotated protein n=1 Tax=freshwater metagenome TaxID=449393 RepID=A0A6J7M1E8_9ZZZZ|nr:UDP-glucose 4-epimerase GalE [Actinomycetota bacterium]MSW26296.1 UDP-glucose 4-epimerase GalE [Actinomycetota bacterium]MSW34613.1 UDP-glucose 4-epimerase GalE [Actinomycetota bacterium]MSX31639.1 UDP-glucose 4-epimerase GalE [Actinomycetota bacterium]MSX51265.1 UDP-glucose 4-epimerase GalE [Actinomycetota bacterium]
MRILVTGGAGYIGATAVDILLTQGFDVTVLDDCSTGHADSVPSQARFIEGSLLDAHTVREALTGASAVLHFAGKSLVGESVVKPDLYHEVNVHGTRILLEEMRTAAIQRIVFSSSAATYGEPVTTPILESAATSPTNPYGETKLAVDNILTQEGQLHGLGAISLRYFNVAGAHKSQRGWLPERHDTETHLIPNVLRSTPDKPVKIFGTDWSTVDGTCIRDYVHVVDLIDAHISALQKIQLGSHEVINLGSGRGYSVREVLSAASSALGHQIPAQDSSRRSGDPAVLLADIKKASTYLGWTPTRDLLAMVTDTAASFQLS